jgi:hypothetical protein
MAGGRTFIAKIPFFIRVIALTRTAIKILISLMVVSLEYRGIAFAQGLTAAQRGLMDTAAAIVGRAIGCQLSEAQSLNRELAEWISRKMSQDEASRQVRVVMSIISANSDMQSKGRTPTTCIEVSKIIPEVRSTLQY